MTVSERLAACVKCLLAQHQTETELGVDTDYARFWQAEIDSLDEARIQVEAVAKELASDKIEITEIWQKDGTGMAKTYAVGEIQRQRNEWAARLAPPKEGV